MYIADLHIHSRFSRATSREGNPGQLDLWARRKGIHIVGTGDFTHPEWRKELEEKLEPAEDGFYTLKAEYRIKDPSVPDDFLPRFVVTGEISSIYKKMDRVRKVHSVILLPGLEEAGLLSKKLETIGNIHSDGRPILGLDCRDLLEITMDLCPRSIYVPAHIWTPHFSLFGAFSGFDTVEECFEDMTPYVHAVETGLSSDPPMNWRLSALDSYQLISNSDAHSPSKLGREANLMEIPLSYDGLYGAVQEGKGLKGTIEFFPEEGKYHYDGHRKCHLCLSPAEAARYDGKCPVCGRKLTIGVSHRIEQLADREEGYILPGAKRFESVVPLPEVIAASTGRSSASIKVEAEYKALVGKLGPEFEILRNVPVEDIRHASGRLVAEGIRRLREGRVNRIPGYDGEYGKIRLFEPSEIENPDGQMSFFTSGELFAVTAEAGGVQEEGLQTGGVQADGIQAEGLQAGKAQTDEKIRAFEENLTADGEETGVEAAISEAAAAEIKPEPDFAAQNLLSGLNDRQLEAVTVAGRAIAVVAGPGTGKTKTLISRILYLLKERNVKPSEITAVTFTKKAAGEMQERLLKELGGKRTVNRMRIGTFHGICHELLKEAGLEFKLAGDMETLELAGQVIKELNLSVRPKQFLRQISLMKTGLSGQEPALRRYQELLKTAGVLDFDDLLTKTLALFENQAPENRKLLEGFSRNFSFLLVDEFQDISPVQFRLIKAWNRSGRELFVIGDPDQAIYSFRGADSGCFKLLAGSWPQLKTISLVENYRSTEPILAGAISVISRNEGEERILRPRGSGGSLIRLAEAKSELSEAIFVAKEINRMVGGIDMLDAQGGLDAHNAGTIRGFADIAVLYRTHHQAALLEDCLKKEGIPYVVAGRDDFLTEEKTRGTVCFFQYLLDREDCLAKETAGKLLWGLEAGCLTDSILDAAAEQYQDRAKKEKPSKLLERFCREMELTENEALQKLCSMALFYKTMADFLEALSFGQEGDLKRCGGKAYTSDAVALMTLHGSKGLEFPAVFLTGVRKGMIPFESGKEPVNQEEERRLFYVGMTRAKEELILTTSKEKSPFLADIPEHILVREETVKKQAEEGRQMNLSDFMKM